MFIEKDEILRNSRYSSLIESLQADKFDELLKRTDTYITIRTRKDYSETNNPLIKQTLKTITWRLMDYLFYFDNDFDMENHYAGIQSESIGGDYSYTLKSDAESDVGIGLTGDKELDLLLDSLTVIPSSPMYFSTGIPKKKGW